MSTELAENVSPCPLCRERAAHLWRKVETFLLVRCATCSLVYLGNPPDERALYEEYYSGQEPALADYRPDSGNSALAELAAINQQRIRIIRKMKPSGRLLDVGCGRGFFLTMAESVRYRASGIDVSERAVAYASSIVHAEASTGSLQTLVTEGEQFEIITAWHVLEHFPDPLGELNRIRSLLSPGGLLFVEVPNLRSLRFMLAREKWRGGDHPRYHRTFFTAHTLRLMLEKARFKNVRRLPLSYSLPARSPLYTLAKRVSNAFAADAFVDFVAEK